MIIQNAWREYNMKDEGCPTCGSENFGLVEMRKEDDKAIWKKKCYSCKKFWYSEF